MKPGPSDARPSSPARRTSLDDLERLFGAKARSDLSLLMNHVVDAECDPKMVESMVAAICTDLQPRARLSALFEQGAANVSSLEVFRGALQALTIDHPLTGHAAPTVDVDTAFDLRRAGELLRFHAKAGALLQANMVVVLLDRSRPLTGWRICVVDEVFPIKHGSVVYLKRILENETAINDKPLEPAVVVVALSVDLKELVAKSLAGRGMITDLLQDVAFSSGFAEGAAWTLHNAQTSMLEVDSDAALSISGTCQDPTVVAVHQRLPPHQHAGGYRFGVRWRCLSGAAVTALRIVSLDPEGEVVLAQLSTMITPEDGWIAVDQTVLTKSMWPIRFEIGVLNIASDIKVQFQNPFIETFDGLWKSSDAEAF